MLDGGERKAGRRKNLKSGSNGCRLGILYAHYVSLEGSGLSKDIGIAGALMIARRLIAYAQP
jgi:hypothetical protein